MSAFTKQRKTAQRLIKKYGKRFKIEASTKKVWGVAVQTGTDRTFDENGVETEIINLMSTTEVTVGDVIVFIGNQDRMRVNTCTPEAPNGAGSEIYYAVIASK